MRDRSSIDKHKAIQVAILMPKCSSSRIIVVNFLQQAYEGVQYLNIDILQHKLEQMVAQHHTKIIVDVNYYMLCLRMEMQQHLRIM